MLSHPTGRGGSPHVLASPFSDFFSTCTSRASNAHSVHMPQGTQRALDVGFSHRFLSMAKDPHRWGMCCRFPVKFAGIQGRGCASRRFLFYRVSTVFVFVDNAPMQRSLMSTVLLILCDSPHRFRSNLLVYGKWGKLRKHSSDKDETNPLVSCRQKKKGPGGRRLRLVNARYFLGGKLTPR